MPELSPRQVEQLADILDLTCRSIQSGLSEMGLEDEEYDVTDIEDALLDRIELCQGCDWWHEPGQLSGIEDHHEPGYCDQCRESGHGS